MTLRADAPARPAPGRSPVRRVLSAITLDYLLSHLGYFALLPVLPLLVPRLDPGAGAWSVGFALLALTFAVRGGSLFCGGVLHRAPVRGAMVTGLLLAAAGFGALPLVPGVWAIVACLVVAGFGISVNALTARAYVAVSLPGAADRSTVFSAIQVAVNVSAALGPVIANLLFGSSRHGVLLGLVGALYAVAAVAVTLTVPSGLRLSDGDARPPLRLGLLKAVVTDPAIRRVSLLAGVGSLLYAQFFSALALQIAGLTQSTALRSGFFTLNAVLVVALQIPVTLWMNRGLEHHAGPVRYLRIGLVVFAVAFALLGADSTGLITVFVALAVFSLAETVFTPTVSTAFAGLDGDRPIVEVFNLRQVATAGGESLGSFAGGTLFLLASAHGLLAWYWSALAAVGLLTAALVRVPHTPTGPARDPHTPTGPARAPRTPADPVRTGPEGER
ncbi:MFS transporter [Streptomyces sp. B1I3]|uniref:MFS transporter n=1 Tax=Streptomyces sp. B1I3 TaxID=3042264 RepID=UPI00358F25A8